jgi:hypothetical protein
MKFPQFMEMDHPHSNKHHIVSSYRQYILGLKRKEGVARSLVHYKDIINSYRTAKRQLLAVPISPQ